MQHTITGSQLIGYSESAEGPETFTSRNPDTGAKIPWDFHEATAEEAARAVQLAAARASVGGRTCRWWAPMEQGEATADAGVPAGNA